MSQKTRNLYLLVVVMTTVVSVLLLTLCAQNKQKIFVLEDLVFVQQQRIEELVAQKSDSNGSVSVAEFDFVVQQANLVREDVWLRVENLVMVRDISGTFNPELISGDLVFSESVVFEDGYGEYFFKIDGTVSPEAAYGSNPFPAEAGKIDVDGDGSWVWYPALTKAYNIGTVVVHGSLNP